MDKQTVEKQIEGLIEKYELQDQLSVEKVKEWIWNEEGDPMQATKDYQMKFINYFTDKAEDIDEMNDIVEIIMNAWNHFPHKSLNGKAPAEMYNNKS